MKKPTPQDIADYTEGLIVSFCVLVIVAIWLFT